MNVLILFTYGISLQEWKKIGIFEREIALYKELIKKNVKISFLTYGEKKDLIYNEMLNDFEIIPAKNLIQSQNFILKFLKSLILPFKLKLLFKKVDIIKSNQIEGCWVSFLAKIFFRKKIIIRGGYEWLTTFAAVKSRNGFKNTIKFIIRYIYIYLIEFIGFRLADQIFLTNPYYIDFIIKAFRLKRYKSKLQLIPNFIDVNLFKPKNVDRKKNYILFVGRLTIEKNLYNLIIALKDLKDFTLDIVGNGPLKNDLIKFAEKLGVRINILGVFPNDKLPEIYNRYELFILPSYFEGNPKALLEAMSCGIPCIGTQVRGINEIIINGQNGYSCKTNPESIRNAILYFYKNKDNMQKIGQNARDFIIHNFSLNIIVNKEYKSYKRLYYISRNKNRMKI